MRRICAALALTLIPALAHAQAPECFPRDDLVAVLASKYHETQIARGVANNGALIELFASRDGRTWTLIVSTPGGVSCPVVDGESWQITGDTGEPS